MLIAALAYEADAEGARRVWRETLELCESVGDARTAAFAHFNLAQPMLNQGRYEEAIDLLTRAVEGFHDVANVEGISVASARHSQALVLAGRLADGRGVAHECLDVGAPMGFRLPVIWAIETLAAVSAADGDAGRACRLVGAAEAIRESVGTAQWGADMLLRELALLAGDDAAARAEGRELTFDEAVKFAAAGDRPAG